MAICEKKCQGMSGIYVTCLSAPMIVIKRINNVGLDLFWLIAIGKPNRLSNTDLLIIIWKYLTLIFKTETLYLPPLLLICPSPGPPIIKLHRKCTDNRLTSSAIINTDYITEDLKCIWCWTFVTIVISGNLNIIHNIINIDYTPPRSFFAFGYILSKSAFASFICFICSSKIHFKLLWLCMLRNVVVLSLIRF